MKIKFTKVKTEHAILPEFVKLLGEIEKHPAISRIIPGRINRQQKGSSELRFKVSYATESGIKCMMCKGATAQELFVVCGEEEKEGVKEFLEKMII